MSALTFDQRLVVAELRAYRQLSPTRRVCLSPAEADVLLAAVDRLDAVEDALNAVDDQDGLEGVRAALSP